MARRKKTKEKAIKRLIHILPGWVVVMIICVGICFGVLVESGILKPEDIISGLDTRVFDDDGTEAIPENARSFSVNVIDVGQGDSILICADETSILIDAGEYEYADTVTSFISSKGIKRLDYIIATHPHSDHIGAMGSVVDKFGADKILIPRLPDEAVPTTKAYERFLNAVKNSGGRLTAAVAGISYDIAEINGNKVTLTILSPASGQEYDDLNDYSVSARLDFGNISWLFTGDLSEEGEAQLIADNADVDVTAYKVAHHGSNSSSSEELLRRITPALCVISCGKDNSYGHPHDEVIARLEKYTDSIYRTDLRGTVTVYSEGERLYISCEKEATQDAAA